MIAHIPDIFDYRIIEERYFGDLKIGDYIETIYHIGAVFSFDVVHLRHEVTWIDGDIAYCKQIKMLKEKWLILP